MLPPQENFRPVLFLRDHPLVSDFEDQPTMTSHAPVSEDYNRLRRRLEIAQKSLQVLEDQAAAIPYIERSVTLIRNLEEQRMLVAELQKNVNHFENGKAL